ncbi:hypothetical protein ACHAXR_012153 [Thalassiosira sp. AJA248-18]
MRIKSPSNRYQRTSSSLHSNPKVMMAMSVLFLVLISSLLIGKESGEIHTIRGQEGPNKKMATADVHNVAHAKNHDQYQQDWLQHHQTIQFALSPGELPGYTGWARPEQTLAGYFDVSPLSHPSLQHRDKQSATIIDLAPLKYHSIINAGDKFSLLLTCNHNSSTTIGIIDESEQPPYECPPNGGTLFYVRAYGPSVLTGLVTDHHNASYSVEMQFIDPGEYTLEVVVTFSAPLEFDEFPLNREPPMTDTTMEEEEGEKIEPGYEGYMISGFPLLIRVILDAKTMKSSSSRMVTNNKDDSRKPWCTLNQLTETTPQSALYKGHWQVIDNVARSSHQPLTPDETVVSLDGYRMGLNSVGVRMRYEYNDCELIHIRDIFGGISGGLDKCLQEQLGFNIHFGNGIADDSLAEISNNHTTDARNNITGIINGDSSSSANQTLGGVNEDDNFEGVHVIFIGDSVMKLVRGFFAKLVRGSFGIKTTFLETNGGIHQTMTTTISNLEQIHKREKDKNIKRVILFNTGLHDIDVLCSSKRKRTRNTTNIMSKGESCSDAYREAMVQFVRIIDKYPAELKVFRSTTSGWQKYGNYGFSWQANDMQPMSRSPHLADHFNTIAYDVIQKQQNNGILITDGYWITLPRPDHTETSKGNSVGKHLVHPGFEVLSVFARRWFMLIIWGLCGDSFERCMMCIGGGGGGGGGSDGEDVAV